MYIQKSIFAYSNNRLKMISSDDRPWLMTSVAYAINIKTYVYIIHIYSARRGLNDQIGWFTVRNNNIRKANDRFRRMYLQRRIYVYEILLVYIPIVTSLKCASQRKCTHAKRTRHPRTIIMYTKYICEGYVLSELSEYRVIKYIINIPRGGDFCAELSLIEVRAQRHILYTL